MPSSRTDATAAKTMTSTPNSSLTDGFAPLAAVLNALRYWWFIFVLALLGALIGWLIHFSQPPVYEAVARFSSGIDYVSTGPLTQYEEDTALNAIGDLVGSNDVLTKVDEAARAEGIVISPLDLARSITLEHRVNDWDVRVRYPDARIAQRLANLWSEQGQAVLVDRYRHAQQAEHLNWTMQALENCLASSAAAEPSSGQCSRGRIVDLQNDLQTIGQAYEQERLASQGMFSGLLVGPAAPVMVSARPVLFGQNQLILAGCLIGLLVGAVAVQFDLPRRLLKSRFFRRS